MLTGPYDNNPFKPNIRYFLGGIEIYDREHTLGEELWRFDPNNKKDREKIIKKYILSRFEKAYNYRHRYALLENLKDTLRQKKFDFGRLFDTDFDNPDEAHTSIAWDSDEIDNPRSFFEDIYIVAREVWSDDLERAASEDQSTW